MARKFQAGDRVRVVRNITGEPMTNGVHIGHRGRITDYCRDIAAPYEITRKNGLSDWFNARELELIKRKGNR